MTATSKIYTRWWWQPASRGASPPTRLAGPALSTAPGRSQPTKPSRSSCRLAVSSASGTPTARAIASGRNGSTVSSGRSGRPRRTSGRPRALGESSPRQTWRRLSPSTAVTRRTQCRGRACRPARCAGEPADGPGARRTAGRRTAGQELDRRHEGATLPASSAAENWTPRRPPRCSRRGWRTNRPHKGRSTNASPCGRVCSIFSAAGPSTRPTGQPPRRLRR
jgi:hypothetical protein